MGSCILCIYFKKININWEIPRYTNTKNKQTNKQRKTNEPDVLSNQKTDLAFRGDVGLLVPHLHGISSGLQHSSVIISYLVFFYVPQDAWSLHECVIVVKCESTFIQFHFEIINVLERYKTLSRRLGKSTDSKDLSKRRKRWNNMFSRLGRNSRFNAKTLWFLSYSSNTEHI